MRYFLSTLVALCWALWFGGLVAVFLIITRVFNAFHDKPELFGQIGSTVFIGFERFQLIAGGAALIFAFALRLVGPSNARTGLLALLMLAAVGAVASPTLITPKIEAMRQAGETGSPAFRKMHGVSMMVYSADTLVLLAAGAVLPAALSNRRDASDDAARA